MSFYSSAFHTNRDAFDMHVSNLCDHLLVQKKLAIVDIMQKKKKKTQSIAIKKVQYS